MGRGVFFAPWRDHETERDVVVLIDRHHRCVHQLVTYEQEECDSALERAAALLNVLDPPRRRWAAPN